MIPHDTHLQIGSLLFEGVDQIDLTGPFEVLSRIPNSTYRIYGKTSEPVRDLKGLRLTPDATLAEAPPLDVLHVPGGYGQEALIEDAELRGDEAAQTIQLHMVYAPEPPFNSGTPETAPTAIVDEARQSMRGITARREATARRVAAKLGVSVPEAAVG